MKGSLCRTISIRVIRGPLSHPPSESSNYSSYLNPETL